MSRSSVRLGGIVTALGLVVASLAVAGAGCDDEAAPNLPPPPTKERSNVVVATGTGSAKAAAPATATATAKAPRKLCAASTTGLQPPKGRIKVAQAAGASAPPTPIPFGAGKWIWVNLWAAWCGPCKEEMPRLLRWNADLRKAGIVIDMAFVSLDDDERQMQRFLDDQPATGLRATYWLPEDMRRAWLQPLGIRDESKLPVQALVSPKGEVVCFVDGTVEDEDYPQLLAMLKAGG
jgi:thiol-disulfide isomerase/thioredoxin